jgi:hypothetical protein
MITRENLPQSFQPFPTLIVCSNTIIGGGHLVSIGDVLPLIIGQGPKPLIWLQAALDPQAKNFVTVVDASISKHPAVRVIEDDKGGVKITTGNTAVLRVKPSGSDCAVVDEIDLRPLGINIHGDASTLNAGGATFSGSTFSGVRTIIAFGK